MYERKLKTVNSKSMEFLQLEINFLNYSVSDVFFDSIRAELWLKYFSCKNKFHLIMNTNTQSWKNSEKYLITFTNIYFLIIWCKMLVAISSGELAIEWKVIEKIIKYFSNTFKKTMVLKFAWLGFSKKFLRTLRIAIIVQNILYIW